jgi:hypothetical protein
VDSKKAESAAHEVLENHPTETLTPRNRNLVMDGHADECD